MSAFGWGSVLIIAFSIYIAIRINKKNSNKKNGRNIFFCVFISLIIFCINFLAYGFAFTIVANSASMIAGNKYEAVIVDYTTRKGTTTPVGSTSKSLQTVYYYNPIAEYTNSQGDTVRKEVNIGETKVPVIGERIIISENSGENVNNISTTQSFLFMLMYLFVSLLISLSLFITLYSFDVKRTKNMKLSKQVFFGLSSVGCLLYISSYFIG